MKRLINAWNTFWFSEFDPVSVGMFRICLGMLITVSYIALLPNWERFYAMDGVMSLNDPDIAGRARDIWSVFYVTKDWLPVGVFWWIGLTASVCFTIGWQTRIFTVVLFIMQSSQVHQSYIVVNGDDLVFRMLLFYGMFAPLGAALSLDARSGAKKGGRKPSQIWAVRAMQINFLLIYALSLPVKLTDDPAWLNGAAFYLAMINSTWSRFPWPQILYQFNGFLSGLLTYATIYVEAAILIGIWVPRTRLPVILTMAAFHLMIAVFLNGVAFFSLSMVCGLWIFVPGEVTRSLLKEAGEEFASLGFKNG